MKLIPYKILFLVLISLLMGGKPVEGGSSISSMLSKITGGASKITDDAADVSALEHAAEEGTDISQAATAAEKATQTQWIKNLEAERKVEARSANLIKTYATALGESFGTGIKALFKINNLIPGILRAYKDNPLFRDSKIQDCMFYVTLIKAEPRLKIQYIKSFMTKLSWWKDLPQWEQEDMNMFIEEGQGQIYFTSKKGGTFIPKVILESSQT